MNNLICRYNECIDDCDQAIALDSKNVKAYYRRMIANEELGNDIMALKDCENVLKLEPKNGDAKRCKERINARLISNGINGNILLIVIRDENIIVIIFQPKEQMVQILLL